MPSWLSFAVYRRRTGRVGRSCVPARMSTLTVQPRGSCWRCSPRQAPRFRAAALGAAPSCTSTAMTTSSAAGCDDAHRARPTRPRTSCSPPRASSRRCWPAWVGNAQRPPTRRPDPALGGRAAGRARHHRRANALAARAKEAAPVFASYCPDRPTAQNRHRIPADGASTSQFLRAVRRTRAVARAHRSKYHGEKGTQRSCNAIP